MKKQGISFAVALLLFVAATAALLYVPSLAPLYFPFVLAIYIALILSEGKWAALVLCAVSCAGMAYFTNTLVFALLTAVLPLLAGVFAGKKIRNCAPQKQVVAVCGAAAGIFFAGILFSTDGMNAETLNSYFDSMRQTLEENTAILLQEGAIDSEYAAALTQQADLIFEQIRNLFPALLFVFAALSGYLSMWITVLLNRIFKAYIGFRPAFSEFKCSMVTAGITVIVCLASLFVPEGIVSVALDNAFAILSFLLCVCTASLADYWMKQKKWVLPLRALLVVLLITNFSGSILSLVMCMIAIVDSRADFRRLER